MFRACANGAVRRYACSTAPARHMYRVCWHSRRYRKCLSRNNSVPAAALARGISAHRLFSSLLMELSASRLPSAAGVIISAGRCHGQNEARSVHFTAIGIRRTTQALPSRRRERGYFDLLR